MEIYKNLSLEDLDGEIWKEIEGYNRDYYVSNFGRVKSLIKWNGTNERILMQNKNNGKYLFVGLYKNGKPKTKKIHVLMYETFIEKIPEGCVVHHIDFTKNNILDNFQMMTNGEHSRLHKPSEETKKLMRENSPHIKGENHPMYGTKRPGEKSGHHTLKEQDVIEIRLLCDEGILTQKQIAKKFGVSRMTISAIKNNRRWKHIK